MSFKCDVSVRIRPGALDEIKERIAVGWKNVVLECVGETKKRSPHVSGNNMRSINPAGVVDRYENIDINPEKIEGDVFGTSGYSGYLECGTHKMPARPYIIPAVEHVMRHVAPGILKDTL